MLRQYVPHIYASGPLLNVLLLSWLYAFYCYDYGWSLQGRPLAARLAAFESQWAFFAGVGGPKDRRVVRRHNTAILTSSQG
jgi:etoposide-induced 2.4 mRNA